MVPKLRCTFAYASFLISLCVSATGWDDYAPSSIAKAVAAASWQAPCDTCFTPGLPYRVAVEYTGAIRVISPERQRFIGSWLKSIGTSPDAAAMFQQEIAVRESGREYWLPIQDKLLSALRHKAKSGQAVKFFIVLAGAISWKKPGEDIVFLVNEFDAR